MPKVRTSTYLFLWGEVRGRGKVQFSHNRANLWSVLMDLFFPSRFSCTQISLHGPVPTSPSSSCFLIWFPMTSMSPWMLFPPSWPYCHHSSLKAFISFALSWSPDSLSHFPDLSQLCMVFSVNSYSCRHDGHVTYSHPIRMKGRNFVWWIGESSSCLSHVCTLALSMTQQALLLV